MEDLSVEELASNLSTYKEQLREVSSPPPRSRQAPLPAFPFRLRILLARPVLASVLASDSGFARGCNRIPRLWIFGSGSRVLIIFGLILKTPFVVESVYI